MRNVNKNTLNKIDRNRDRVGSSLRKSTYKQSEFEAEIIEHVSKKISDAIERVMPQEFTEALDDTLESFSEPSILRDPVTGKSIMGDGDSLNDFLESDSTLAKIARQALISTEKLFKKLADIQNR